MIPVAKPYFTKAEEKAVAAVVRSGWVLQGPRVEEFEQLLKEYLGTSYAVATSSATTALHMALLILGIGQGDEVLVPSFSYIASTNCVVHANATPVFVDIDPQTYNLDPKDIERKITSKTKAIMAVHQVGLPAYMPEILAIAKNHNLFVIEDGACALGAMINGSFAGTLGHIGCFSFHPRKLLTTAEGGLLVTNNEQWANTAAMLRAHGADASVHSRHTSKTIYTESFPIVGYNYRMSDIHAAMGLEQYKKLPKILLSRKRQAARYTKAFKNHPRLVTPFVPKGYTHTFQSYLLRIENGARIRDRLMQQLLDNNIATRRGIPSAHLEPPYRKMYPDLSLPETEKATAETVTIPMFVQMTQTEQDFVIETLLKELNKLT